MLFLVVDLLSIIPEKEELNVAAGESVTLQIYIVSVDGPANISLYKDGNYDIAMKSTSRKSGIWKYEISLATESDAAMYEFVATRDDYRRIATRMIMVQDDV